MKKFWVALILIVAVVFVVWQTWLAGPGTEAEKKIKAWEAAMKADTFGGETPEETLKMFVAALRAGDIEQASRFFLLDENLSREQWLKRLTELKEKNLLSQMAEDIENRAKPDLDGRTHEDDYKFVILTTTGEIGGRINMGNNTFSSVWKIENF